MIYCFRKQIKNTNGVRWNSSGERGHCLLSRQRNNNEKKNNETNNLGFQIKRIENYFTSVANILLTQECSTTLLHTPKANVRAHHLWMHLLGHKENEKKKETNIYSKLVYSLVANEHPFFLHCEEKKMLFSAQNHNNPSIPSHFVSSNN